MLFLFLFVVSSKVELVSSTHPSLLLSTLGIYNTYITRQTPSILSSSSSSQQNFPAISITPSRQTRLQNPFLNQILHQAKNHPITASCSHNIDRDGQVLVMKCNIAKIFCRTHWHDKVRTAPKGRCMTDNEGTDRRCWRVSVLVSIIDIGLGADVEEERVAACFFVVCD